MNIKKFSTIILTTMTIFFNNLVYANWGDNGDTITEVPQDIYTWVQSTPRCNYWFNHRDCGYKINPNGTLDLNTLIVPTICTFDNIQIEDVKQRRRWERKSLKGYERLAGRADYLKFDLKNSTVQIIKRVDLDDTWAELDVDTSGTTIALNSIPVKDLRYNLYRKILEWARKNNELIIGRSKGKLSEQDGNLPLNGIPINKVFIPSAN